MILPSSGALSISQIRDEWWIIHGASYYNLGAFRGFTWWDINGNPVVMPSTTIDIQDFYGLAAQVGVGVSVGVGDGGDGGTGDGVGDGGGAECVIGSARVLMLDGSLVPIFLLYPGVVTSCGVVQEVVRHKRGNRKLYGFNGSPFFVTEDHVVQTITDRGFEWVRPDSIVPGVHVLNRQGPEDVVSALAAEEVAKDTWNQDLYNLRIEGCDRFVCEGFVLKTEYWKD